VKTNFSPTIKRLFDRRIIAGAKQGKAVLLAGLAVLLTACNLQELPEPESSFFACDFFVRTVGGGRAIRIVRYYGNDTEILIPSTVSNLPVTEIGSSAFYNGNITKVSIPDSVTKIGHWAFTRNELENVFLPNSLTAIEGMAFARNRLTDVVIPNSVAAIGGGAFTENELENVHIPNGVTSIGIWHLPTTGLPT